jgi:glycosyltransferase involved in cell wall biosynthesis
VSDQLSTLENHKIDAEGSTEGSQLTPSPPRVIIASRCTKTIYSQRLNLARTVRGGGWDVVLAGQPVQGPFAELIEQEGMHFCPVPINQQSLSFFSLISAVVVFWSLCLKQKPDIFHAFTIKPTVAGLIGAWLAGVPTRVATVAGLGHIFVSSSRIVSLAGMALLRIALSNAQRVYFYNEHDRQTYIRHRIVKLDKTKVIEGSGVDTERYGVSHLPDGECFQLLYIGRIIQEKGIKELLAAMQMVRSSRPVVLHIVGDLDPHNPSSLDRELFETQISSISAIWHGHSNDVSSHITAADAVILPSYSEGIPLALLEAGASGRPMIATDVPGCRDVVRHGLTGFLVPLGDVDKMSQAITTMADNRDLVKEMGRNARDDIVKRFDSGTVNRKMLADYNQLRSTYSVFPAKTET